MEKGLLPGAAVCQAINRANVRISYIIRSLNPAVLLLNSPYFPGARQEKARGCPEEQVFRRRVAASFLCVSYCEPLGEGEENHSGRAALISTRQREKI